MQREVQELKENTQSKDVNEIENRLSLIVEIARLTSGYLRLELGGNTEAVVLFFLFFYFYFDRDW